MCVVEISPDVQQVRQAHTRRKILDPAEAAHELFVVGMNRREFKTLIADGGVPEGPGTAVKSVREFNGPDVYRLSGNSFATQDAIRAPAFEIAAGHHHVPGGDGIKIANGQECPNEWQEERRGEQGVLDGQTPLTSR